MTLKTYFKTVFLGPWSCNPQLESGN